MDLAKVSKAVWAGVATAATTGGADAAGLVDLPPDTPWWGRLIAYLVPAIVVAVSTYAAPANKPTGAN